MSDTTVTKEQINVVKKKLSRYVHLRFESDKLIERLARMKSAEIFSSSPEVSGGGASQPNPHRQENAIIRRMSQESKIADRISALQLEMDEIEKTIDSLVDPLEREVLRERYIYCENNRHTEWKDITLSIYGTDNEKHLTAIYRLHGRALVSLSEIMKG